MNKENITLSNYNTDNGEEKDGMFLAFIGLVAGIAVLIAMYIFFSIVTGI